MARKTSPLTKARLMAILDLYGPMTLREVGGYDTGVHFRFDGRPRSESTEIISGRRHCNRLISWRGFESEVVTYRNRGRNSLGDFWAKVAERRGTLERWMREHADHRGNRHDVPTE